METAIVVLSLSVLGLAVALIVVTLRLVDMVQQTGRLEQITKDVKSDAARLKEAVAGHTPK